MLAGHHNLGIRLILMSHSSSIKEVTIYVANASIVIFQDDENLSLSVVPDVDKHSSWSLTSLLSVDALICIS